MKITLITPAPLGSKAGNRATAERWATLLEGLGHAVTVVTDYDGGSCDLLIALHAWRSHEAIGQFRQAWPDTPLIVALTGTDIYDHQHRFPEQTRFSMAAANCLIGLHRLVDHDIPLEYASKLITVLQSAPAPESAAGPASEKPSEVFQVCVIGHLRKEKDSLRAALAARHLPAHSKVQVVNAGKAHSPEWETQALQEQADNPRFHWLGEISREETQRLMGQSDLMVISSRMEGGANVVSEACRLGLPILASDIPGNVGLLGTDYPGYFKPEDEQDLARILERAETEPEFLQLLADHVRALAENFTPEAEQAALAKAVEHAMAGR